MAPRKINVIPNTHPLSAKTYGKERTPDPIAHAQRENILPLTLPAPIFENVL